MAGRHVVGGGIGVVVVFADLGGLLYPNVCSDHRVFALDVWSLPALSSIFSPTDAAEGMICAASCWVRVRVGPFPPSVRLYGINSLPHLLPRYG